MRPLLLVFTMLAFRGIARAQTIDASGNEFLNKCSVIEKSADVQMSNLSDIEIVQADLCIYYLRGVADGVQAEKAFLQELSGANKFKYPVPSCVPDGVKVDQIARIVLKYIRNNPEISHYPTAALVMDALGTTFPCTAGK
jgi:hypothetical protein